MSTYSAIGSFSPGSVSTLQKVTVPKPTPTGRDILVRVKAVSVNPVDYKVRSSRSPTGDAPVIVGWDAAGIVESVGEDAKFYKAGDEVYFAGAIGRDGSNGDYALVDERIVGNKPSSLSFEQAAAYPLVSLTAWEALVEQAHIAIPQDTTQDLSLLIINGAGGVGSIAIYIASKILKIKNIIATASRPETIDWVKKLGATHVVNHHEPIKPQLESQALGSSVDYVFVAYDTDAYFDKAVELAKPFGHIIFITPPSKPVQIDSLFQKSLTLSFEFMFAKSATGHLIDTQRTILNSIGRHLDAEPSSSSLVTKSYKFNLANLREAQQQVEESRVFGKVVLTLDEENWD